MRILFVRHGDPNYADDCLTDLGRKQAAAVAKRLEDENIEAIFSSPLGRAMETMKYYSDLYPDTPVQVLDFMPEITWGSIDGTDIPLQGHPWDCTNEMIKEGISISDPMWQESPFFRNNIARLEVDKISAGIDKWLEGFGYSREGMYYRNNRADSEQHSVVLFSHGGSSSAAMAHMLNIPFPLLCATLHMPCTAVNILRLDTTPGSLCTPVMELMSDGRHILDIE